MQILQLGFSCGPRRALGFRCGCLRLGCMGTTRVMRPGLLRSVAVLQGF